MTPKKKEKTMKRDDKVKIISGEHAGETGVIRTVFENGAVVERDFKDERRFCTVKFEHLEENDQLD